MNYTIALKIGDRSLDNGFKYIYYNDHDNAIVCLQAIVRIGSAFEDDNTRGFSHFLEHLVFKATKSFPHNNISDYVSLLGGSFNAYTDFDSTCYYLLLPSEHLTIGIMLLSELLRHTSFTDMDVKMEKEIICEEIRQYDNDPEMAFTEFIQADYFQHNPLRFPIIGTTKQIKNSKPAALREFYSRFYRPDNCFLVACGQFDPESLRDSIDTYFGDWQNPKNTLDSSLKDKWLNPELNPSRIVETPIKTDNPYLAIVVPELSDRHPDGQHTLIAMRYLAIGKPSLLHKRLVEKERLCSGVRVLSVSGLLSGISIILLSPLDARNVAPIIAAFKEEYQKAMDFDPPGDSFALIHKDLIHCWLYDLDSMESLASAIAADELLGDYRRLLSYPEEIEGIDQAAVRSVVQRYWNSSSPGFYSAGLSFAGLDNKLYQAKTKAQSKHKPVSDTSTTSWLTASASSKNLSMDIAELAPNAYYWVFENGFKVLYKQSPFKPVSGFALSTDMSQLMETPATRGYNYFASTCLLYGSEEHSFEQIQDYSRQWGLNIRVSHQMDCTGWRGKCFRADLPRALALMAELLFQPSYDRKHFLTLKHTSLDNLRRDKDFPVTYAFNRWLSMLFGKANNVSSTSGRLSDMERISLDGLPNWHKYLRNPAKLSLSIVGNHSPDEIYSLTENLFASRAVPADSLEALPYYQTSRSHQITHKHHSDQAVVQIGSFAPRANDEELNAAFNIISQAIGGEIGSRFFNILREKYGLAYQAGFEYNAISFFGFWYAFALCSPEDVKQVRTLMKEILMDVQRRGLSKDEISMSKSYILGMQRFDSESASWLASSMANLLALGYPPDYYFHREERIRQVSPESIYQASRIYLNKEDYFIFSMV